MSGARLLSYLVALGLLGGLFGPPASWASDGDDVLLPADAEHGLLHLRLDLGAARRWQDGRLTNEPLVSKKPLLVVHLFSLDCPPCIEELPLLKSVFQPNMPAVDFALVLETLDAGRIREFLQQRGASMPPVPLYLATDRRLRGTSQLGIDTIPVTLLLDRQRVVRQAFVGSLKDRMHAFGEALVGLLPALSEQPKEIVSSFGAGQKVQSERLLHHSVELGAIQKAISAAVPIKQRSEPRVNVLYLYGEGCKECSEDLDGRLRRLVKGWDGVKDVRFSLINCDAASSELPNRLPPKWPEAMLSPCADSHLHDIWMHDKRPITLLVDSHRVVRDAFIGPLSSSVGVAVRRLLAGPR